MKKWWMLLFLLFSFSTHAAYLTDIVFFGDSLSDDGNLYRLLKILPKSPPYYKGRFSNGATWAEHVGDYYYKNYFLDYSNYAYGGATAILHHLRTDPFISPMLLAAELDNYLMRNPLQDKSKVLFGVWIGANDYLYERTEYVEELTTDVVDKIIWLITTLIEKGGNNFFVLNLPDLGLTPYAKAHGNAERLTMLAVMHNKKLNEKIIRLKLQYPGVNILLYDTYSIFVDLVNDPEKYNQKYGTHITDTQNACWPGTVLGLDENALNTQLSNQITASVSILGTSLDANQTLKMIQTSPALSEALRVSLLKEKGLEPCDNADEHLFWDDMHPTAVVHRVLGQIITETLQH